MLRSSLLGLLVVAASSSVTLACSAQQQLTYLTGALYREANPSNEGQAAVAAAIFNRVDSPKYPDTICAVVTASGQFHYAIPKHPDATKLALAKKNAKVFLAEYNAGRHRLEADVFVQLTGYHSFRSYPGKRSIEVDGNHFRVN